MAKRIFLWLAHPNPDSLCAALAAAYQRGAENAGAEVRRQNLAEMNFDPNLAYGYQQRIDLEPDLVTWRENLLWADHTCWIYPIWWGGMPAKTKGVIDRCYLPGFAMNYHQNDPWWDKLLTGRSADVLLTADTPNIYSRIRYGVPATRQVKGLVLGFAGIKPVRFKHFAIAKLAKPAKVEKWLRQAELAGAKAARS